MATKLDRKRLPVGYTPDDFTYQGRPARDQGDFGADVGLMDAACVNQFGETDKAKDNLKFYHAGVVRPKDGSWWVYLQWGRITSGKSWQGGTFVGNDFQFVRCDDEADARKFFASQAAEKNTKRLEQKTIGGKTIWAAKEGKDGYLVQRLATRERGLPDAYGIKDSTGLAVQPKPVVTGGAPVAKPKKKPAVTFQPEVIRLATDLTGGTVSFAKQRAKEAGGALPTLDAIQDVRDTYIPLVLQQLGRVGNDIHKQVADSHLIDLSKLVWALVPKPMPRSKDPFERAKAAILNADNLLALQDDLDAYESALKADNFDVEIVEAEDKSVDPDTLLNAKLRWLDHQNYPLGKWVANAFLIMHNRRHHYNPVIKNIFEVVRNDRDVKFLAAVKNIAEKRKGSFSLRANLQPPVDVRADVEDRDAYRLANTIASWHGTRSVNIHPIVSTHFRLPRSLSGVVISGANFGHGIYVATDSRKSIGYTSTDSAYWSGGAGGVRGRGAFMFFCDTIMGDAYRAPSTGSWTSPPNGKDSIFGVGGDRGHSLDRKSVV